MSIKQSYGDPTYRKVKVEFADHLSLLRAKCRVASGYPDE